MNVVILDACRDNPFGKVRVEQKGLSQLDAPPGTLLAYATSPGNTAADGAGKNGLYTEYLLREIHAREAKIEDIFKRVRLNVRRESYGRQIPWESTSLEEDFYFMPPAQIKKLTPEEIERQFEEELGIWEKIKGAKDAAPLENYLRRFPSGRFSELAQFRLDRLLAQQEKLVRAEAELKKQQELAKAAADRKRQEELARAEPATPAPVPSMAPILVASIAPNPFSRGTASADANYKIGDRYSYRVIDTLTKLETGQFTRRVTGITDNEVVFNSGRTITDLLGNYIKEPNGNENTGQQLYVAEYRVGKKWTTRYRARRAADGSHHTFEFDFKVVARENITVLAGTFDAFKVEGRGFNIGQGNQVTYVYWIAPDKARMPIAWENITLNRRGRYMITNRNELVSYRQSD